MTTLAVLVIIDPEGQVPDQLLGNAFGGIVMSDRFSAYNHLATLQRQLCWAQLIRNLSAIA